MSTHTEWWRGAVIYQIYPRSFFDSNDDGIGDLTGITSKLAYIDDLGVDAIWLSPFFQSPMKDFGYDISDYRAIDPIFGTLQDFDLLVEKAHSLGLKIILDLVLNHSSDQHPWFQESRKNLTNSKADWYVWADAKPDGSAPNNWLAVFGGSAWQWDKSRQQYYLHNFLVSQPDLNFHNPQLRQQVLDETEFWLMRGVDGIRLDVVNYYYQHLSLQDNPHKSAAEMNAFMGMKANPYNEQQHVFDKSQPENLHFLKSLRKLINCYPNATSLGEIGDDNAAQLMGEYTCDGDKLHMAYCFRLLRESHGAYFIRQAVEDHEHHIGDGWPCWAMSNHDTERVASRWASGESANPMEAFLFLALLLSLRGSVCIYNGEELGLPEATIRQEDLHDPFGLAFWPEYKGRDGCRTPMVWHTDGRFSGFSKSKPWLPIADAHKLQSVDQQLAQEESVLNKFKRIIRWRRQQTALINGSIEFLDCVEDCLLFARRNVHQNIVCAFNLSDLSKDIYIPPSVQAHRLIKTGLFDSKLSGSIVSLPAHQAAYWLC